MHLDTALHTPSDIQQVAQGLVAVVGVPAAAEELRRLYGAERSADALLLLARQHRAAAGGREVVGRIIDLANDRVSPAVQSPARPEAAAPGRAARAREIGSTGRILRRPASRRPAPTYGRRPSDWL
jgi:hypothetical protein